MTTDEPSRDSILRQMRKAHREWPTFLSDSAPSAERAALALTEGERAEGFERAPVYVRYCQEHRPRLTICSFAVYLREKRWKKLDEVGFCMPEVALQPLKAAAPFGKAWMAVRMRALALGPRPLPPLTPAAQHVIDTKPDKAAMIMDDHRLQHGWPEINRMMEKLAERPPKPLMVDSAAIALGADFQQVMRGGDLEAAWQRFHTRQKLPWLPDSRPEWIYFPAIAADACDLDAAVAAAFWGFKGRIEGHVDAA